jgi:transposase InsO family protein
VAWKDVNVDDQRMRFVLRASSGEEEMSGLCREYGISRPTGYHWLKRFVESESIAEVKERSRRPQHSPKKTSAELEQRVIAERKLRPDWGARKLRVLLERDGIRMQPWTVHRILRRNDLIKAHQQHPPALKRFQRESPNQLWQMDFKGLAKNLSQGWAPLSILDDCSRYLIGLEALLGTKSKPVQQTLESIFQKIGLPEAMLVDHGTPWWNANHPCGWTKLSIWLMNQNIQLHFSAIRHPQTQGKVERFHRSLQDALHERGFPGEKADWPQWLERFREEYNQVRPHESLGMATPASVWQPSSRLYLPDTPCWEYAEGAQVVKVKTWGQVTIGHHEYTVSGALAGQHVALQRLTEDRILVYYRRTCVRELNLQKRQSYAVYFSREQAVFEDD